MSTAYCNYLKVARLYRLDLCLSFHELVSQQPSLRIRASVIEPNTAALQATVIATFLLKWLER